MGKKKNNFAIPNLSGIDLRDAVPDFPDELARLQWQAKACIGIAEGEDGWDEVQPREGDDSEAMKAVRRLRAMFEELISDPRRRLADLRVADMKDAKWEDVLGEQAAIAYLYAIRAEADYHKMRGEKGHAARIKILEYLAGLAIKYAMKERGESDPDTDVLREESYEGERDLSELDAEELEQIARKK